MQNNFETQQVEFQKAMEAICLEMLHQGYEAMLFRKIYHVDWKEDKITAHYIELMKSLELCRDNQVSIIPQFHIYTEEHTLGNEEVEKAPRIDFRFIKWFQREEIDFFAEAKNLSEKSWKKADGKGVDANYYYNRYINTGINHLLSDYYPNRCFLVAYVLNGNKHDVLINLNDRITNDFPKSGYGKIVKPDESAADEYYISENIVGGKGIFIKHLFLQLYQITNV